MPSIHEMFQLFALWWHFALRAIAIYALVMLLVPLPGKRAVGQFTPFDLVLLILLGNAAQNGMNGGDHSLAGAVILAVCLIALNYGVAFVAAHDGKLFRACCGASWSATRIFSKPCAKPGAAGSNTFAWPCWKPMVGSASSWPIPSRSPGRTAVFCGRAFRPDFRG
jgi:hypothetical protein